MVPLIYDVPGAYSVIGYVLEILKIIKTQADRLEKIQNEVMEVILRCTRETAITHMRFMLAMPIIGFRRQMC